jgi:beta-lactamase class A
MGSRQKNLIRIIGSLAIFFAGFFGFYFYQKIFLKFSPGLQLRENSTEYTFINPLLLTDNSGPDAPEYEPLKKSLNEYVEDVKDKGLAQDVSVYFRDVNTGKATGHDEDKLYSPSSMLKVPVLLAYLKLAAKNQDIFVQKLAYEPKDDPGQYYKPTTLPKAGNIPILQLLQLMIIESDNNAMKLLDKQHTLDILEVYEDLKIPNFLSEDEDFMSPRLYSRFFRILYNSTYLPREYSEQALKLLSLTTFTKGLVAGVPEGVKVAHKFGEHTSLVNNVVTERELHDCGIIYSAQDPYFLCVMTRGKDFGNLEKVISGISGLVYGQINKTN